MIPSPYAGEWNFGVMPAPTAGAVMAVVVPGKFIGTVRQSAFDAARWSGGDISVESGGLLVICQGPWWCFSTDVPGEWSDWENLNVWWQVI